MLTGVWCAFFPSRYRICAMASALQMEKEALRHFQKLCFMRTVFQSVRSLRGMGEDVKVCSPHLACSPSSQHTHDPGCIIMANFTCLPRTLISTALPWPSEHGVKRSMISSHPLTLRTNTHLCRKGTPV